MTLSKAPLKIGVFGTAADPPHLGHLEIVKCAKRFLDLDRVIVIPTKIPSHKAEPETSAHARFKMSRLLFTNTPGVLVSDMEIRRRGISYTKDTIAELKKKHPKYRLFWIISLETLLNVPREWREGYKILDLCRFAVVMRRGYKLEKIPATVLAKIVMIKNCRPQEVSSTKIREIISKKGSAARFVGKKVYKFIQKRKLYEKR